MKSLLTWTERCLLRLFCKLSRRQNFHLKAEMFSFHSKYFVYRELKRAPQKLSFCYPPDTGQHTVHKACTPSILFIPVNLLSLSELSPYGSGPASCPRMIKKGKIYIYNQIYNEVLWNHFYSEITRQTTHFWLPITLFLSVFKNLGLRNIT